jgi:hypothetical protein
LTNASTQQNQKVIPHTSSDVILFRLNGNNTSK